MKEAEIVTCPRCGQQCKIEGPGNPEARPFRRANAAGANGLCPSCITTKFIKGLDALMFGIEKNGKQILLIPAVQQQFAAVLVAGRSDMRESEINWQRVVDNWDMPFPSDKRRRAARREVSA